jgi:hypothetical protein
MAAIARWDAFLAQIEGRHRGVRDETEATARQFIASVAGGGDDGLLSQQLAAVHRRLLELEAMIADTWHAKVEDAIFGEGLGVADRDREFLKGQRLHHALEDARDELEPRLYAELARQRYAHAERLPRSVACHGCGQPLAAPVTYRTIEVPCSCGARTEYQPPQLLMSVAAVGTHAVAQEAVVAEWRAMKAAERAMHAIRPPRPLAAVQHTERSQIVYWQAYLAVRSRFEPELARDPAFEIRSRMDQWYRSTAEFEEAWVAAGRPRMI